MPRLVMLLSNDHSHSILYIIFSVSSLCRSSQRQSLALEFGAVFVTNRAPPVNRLGAVLVAVLHALATPGDIYKYSPQ